MELKNNTTRMFASRNYSVLFEKFQIYVLSIYYVPGTIIQGFQNSVIETLIPPSKPQSRRDK